MKPAPTQKLVYRMELSHGGQFDAALYRWEFLRRNSEYCADYNEFMCRFGAWLLKRKGSWPQHEEVRAYHWTKREKKYYRTRVGPALNRLRRKWQVSDLFPPEFGLEEWRADKSDGAPFPPTRVSDVSATGELKRMGFHGTGFVTRHYENLLLIQVDLNSPMKDLLKHTHFVLRSAQKKYRAEMEARGHKLPNGRRRFEDYALHVKIWDLKKGGKRNAEIARLVFPNLSAQSGLYKVRDHLKAAEKLISRHYREIS